MKDTEFIDLMAWKVVNWVLYPINNKANDFVFQQEGNEVYLVNKTPRDTAFHACYFLFCTWLWQQMPTKFKLERCPDKSQMYNYIKILQGKYKVAMEYKGLKFYEFESISFARMNDAKFNEFVNDQITIIYTELLIPLKMEHLLEQAETEFKGMFKKLI